MVSSSEMTSLHISAQPRLCPGPQQATLSLVLQSRPQETLLDRSPRSPAKGEDCILAPTMDSFKLKKGQASTFASMAPVAPTTAMVKAALEQRGKPPGQTVDARTGPGGEVSGGVVARGTHVEEPLAQDGVGAIPFQRFSLPAG